MTGGPVDKIEAARLQLAHALRILDTEDVVAHTLTWAAHCLLRDLLKLDLKGLERALRIGEVPAYLRHAENDPNDILLVHSPATLHLTMALAIRLWEENGQQPTEAMREFNKRLRSKHFLARLKHRSARRAQSSVWSSILAA